MFAKKTGSKPDFADPVMLSAGRGGATVGAFCGQLHASLKAQLAYALVWGTSAKHYPQRVGASHVLHDEARWGNVVLGGGKQLSNCFVAIPFPNQQDVVQIVKKKIVGASSEARGRFKTTADTPLRISDREKKKPLRS